jgi:hypothetical protein
MAPILPDRAGQVDDGGARAATAAASTSQRVSQKPVSARLATASVAHLNPPARNPAGFVLDQQLNRNANHCFQIYMTYPRERNQV